MNRAVQNLMFTLLVLTSNKQMKHEQV